MKTKIYTMTHRAFRRPEDEIYIPLHVGRSNAAELGYLGDDTGENISEQNPYYGELTGLYWIWKNETEADVIGVCHYRRYFLTTDGNLMTQKDYENELENCDILVSEINISSTMTNREVYARCHNIADMEAVGEALRQLYPEDYPIFCKVLSENECCYGNLMVASREKFNEYCSWLFPIFEMASRKIDVSGYDLYHKRVYGFCSELLLYVWVQARGYRFKGCKIGITSEKAETIEFKHVIGQLIAEGNIDEARKTYCEQLSLRPDIGLRSADFKCEVPVIKTLLCILYEEHRRGADSLLSLSRDLSVLIMHCKNVKKLLEQHGKHVREVGAEYFAEFPISDTALEIIEKDIQGNL